MIIKELKKIKLWILHGIETIFTKDMFAKVLELILVEEEFFYHEHIAQEDDMVVL